MPNSNEETLTSGVKIFRDGKEIDVSEAGDVFRITKDDEQINVKVEIDEDGQDRTITEK